MSITAYIKEDLGERLRTGEELPARLTLNSLAKHYQVSFTPVRCAIEELIDEGVLRREANHRLVSGVRRKPRRATKKTLNPPQPPRDPAELIADDLVKLSLGNEAICLREEATAEKYGISRSAIRNIFHQLAGIGLLDHMPRRGWQLRPFKQEDMQAFLEVREVLELKALELAHAHLLKEDLQAMLDLNVLPSSKNVRGKVDDTLHEYIIDKAANIYIKDFFQRHSRYYRILFAWEGQDPSTLIETVRQHRAILEAMLNRNWPAARRALSFHIRHNHPILSAIR